MFCLVLVNSISLLYFKFVGGEPSWFDFKFVVYLFQVAVEVFSQNVLKKVAAVICCESDC